MKKLVRDKIPQIIQYNGQDPKYYQADDQEYHQLLVQKLKEEVGEFIESESPEELADILEVIHTLTNELGISMDEIESLRLTKKRQRGGFKKKYVLEETN
jgi:predicted house-cleaning noncanonical NTP pyrophosphatase (MazG superfamily)